MLARNVPLKTWLGHFLTCSAISIAMTLSAASPEWWLQRDATGHAVIDPTVTDLNATGPANVGQAKYMAKRALDVLGVLDPSLATQIGDMLKFPQPIPSSPGKFLPAVVDLEVPGEPLSKDWQSSQYAPLLIGQLKAIAKPFYDVLHATCPAWLDNESSDPRARGQLQLNGTKDIRDKSNFYPWSSDETDDQDHAVATIGQLKAVFSLRLESLGAILDSDGDGLTNAEEFANHTNIQNADTDGDGMTDSWEVKWGLNPLDPADAAADPDGDYLSNLMEFQGDTSPTGTYLIEMLPLGENHFFHAAADDGSVVMQASSPWDPDTPLELITAPDSDGTRMVVPMPPGSWKPLDALATDLAAAGLLNEGEDPIPCGPDSSNGTCRTYQTHAGLFVLREPGYRISRLPSDVVWQVLNNQGQAAAIVERLVPSTNGGQDRLEADIVVAYGYYTATIPMPDVWFPSTTTPTIIAFSDYGDVLIKRDAENPDGNTNHEIYLLKAYQSDFTLVKQPGLGDESIIALSNNNARMLGTGPKPFMITPDGTPVLLESLQILTNPTTQAVSLGTLFPKPVTPHHITSNGRITLATTDANNEAAIIQIIPCNDADGDGMNDDWEKWYAKGMLALGKTVADWGPLYADLVSGHLNPAADYTGEGITCGEIASLCNRPGSLQSPDGMQMDCQGRRNILAWGTYVPATNDAPEAIGGYYYYENAGYFGASMNISERSCFQPEFMEVRIARNPWEKTAFTSGWSKYAVEEQEDHSFTYNGDLVQTRIRFVASSPSPVARVRNYLKVTRCLSETGDGEVTSEVMDIVAKEVIIPAGRTLSDWIELIPPVVAGHEYSVTLEPVKIAVDANRDGLITFDGKDDTTSEKPFVFWVNDDHDVKHPVDLFGPPFPSTLGQEDVFDDIKDYSDGVITCVRDLEDFTRLHFSVANFAEQLADESMSIGLEFADVTGTPAIKVYLAADPDGRMVYLTENSEGEAQLADSEHNTTLGTVNHNLAYKFPPRIWDTLASNPNTYLIFEGASEGKGSLRLTFNKGEEKIGTGGSVWIELKNIKQMYQRWNANEVDKPGVQWDVWPSETAKQDSDSVDPPPPGCDDEKDFILFVHGWNMTKQAKRGFAETAFKRLWQIGYKGRFGAFFWPTFFEWTRDASHFDGSEQRAWESSDALLCLLTDLNNAYPGRVNVLAHSMGNVVVSEALNKATEVVANHYVASQAALPADVFKLSPDITKQWSRILAETVGAYNLKLPAIKNVVTPNVYAYYYENAKIDSEYKKKQFPEMGYPYMRAPRGAAKWYNYLNPTDWALGLWIWDQGKKPNGLMPNQKRYDYVSVWLDNTWGFKRTDAGINGDFNFLYIPTNRYEIFSYCAQARCNPAGRQSNIGGPFLKQRIFSEYADKHPGHSAQFLESIGCRWKYWRYLLDDCKIKHIGLLEGK